jgi:hypothetical protein
MIHLLMSSLNLSIIYENIGIMSNDKDERDRILKSMYKLAHEFEIKRNIYWTHHKALRYRNHCLSIPLLFVTSFTAATSSAQASNINGFVKPLSIVISVFGVSSAILTALQKYMRYAERSETSKYISKMYGLIASKVKGQIEIIIAGHKIPSQKEYNAFLDKINEEAQSLQLEIDIVPTALMKYDQNKYMNNDDDNNNNVVLDQFGQERDLICIDSQPNCEIVIDK